MPQQPNRLGASSRRRPPSRQVRSDDWDSVVESFLSDCRRRNHTAATLAVYRSALLGPRTRTFLTEHDVRTVGDFTAEQLRAFEEELRGAGLSIATVHQYHRTVKTFLAYCKRERFVVDDGLVHVQAPKLPQVEPEIFTPEEERRLLAGTRSRRDKVLVEFMLRTGLRLSEVLGAEVDDIVDLGDRGAYLRVRQGKGRKDRHVPLEPELYRRLRLWIDRHRPGDGRALFPTMRGPVGPMKPEALKSMLDRLGKDTGVHCNAHKFRHTFASRAIAAGVDPITLQRVLGHTTLTMVSRYVHYSPTDLLEAWHLRRA
jgi:integrase/recombinase XerD